jgi:Flp pilus assembly protein TadG
MFRRLKRDNKGAVLAEFCIAIVPVLTTFFSFVQLSKLATARLVVKHSAIVGARAAAVIANGNDNTPDQPRGTNEGEIADAVKAAMGPWWTRSGGVTSVNVTVTDLSSRADPYDWVVVKVEARYECSVPLGFFVCGGRSKRIEETFRMPHQGALYEM